MATENKKAGEAILNSVAPISPGPDYSLRVNPGLTELNSTITYINQFFVSGVFCWELLLSVCFGIVMTLAYKLDLPEYFDM